MMNTTGTSASENRQNIAAWDRRLSESFETLMSSFVDPAEAVYDPDGTHWNALMNGGNASGIACFDETRLNAIREECRLLAVENEFALNGLENRISYIVGNGHHYRATARRGFSPPEVLLNESQQVLDDFLRVNRWRQRQQEIVRRKDRDGECFLRFFPHEDGILRIRFVEPEQIASPTGSLINPSASFGIETLPGDVETPIGYWIDGVLVDASEIQHRKANVDANVKRGLPLYYPVRKNLRRAEKLLRNMSVVSEIQSAIALIRKHRTAGGTNLDQFVADQADATTYNASTGKNSHFRRFAPGTIIDALANTDYEFPASGIDAGRYVAVLQAELRAIASRLVMPEFMLTSDASNANYSSTMVAEGPAVKMFERLQFDLLEDDADVMRRVLSHAAARGRLSEEAPAAVDVHGFPPSLAVRDRLKDAQADQILVRNGAMSKETMAIRGGLDPERERRLLAKSDL